MTDAPTATTGRLALRLLERDLVPDALIRRAIRRLLRARLAAEDRGDPEAQQAQQNALIEALRASAIAIHTDAANEQHYELPPAFFARVLGRQLKYSCCYYPNGSTQASCCNQLRHD